MVERFGVLDSFYIEDNERFSLLALVAMWCVCFMNTIHWTASCTAESSLRNSYAEKRSCI